MAFSVGIGLTNDCNLHCAHCYRPTDRVHSLSMDDVKAICDHLPVGAIGLGTGENALHPLFSEIVTYLSRRGIRLSMASNGYGLNCISDEQLRAFHDVEVSIDFSSEREQDSFRGTGNWKEVHKAMDRCESLGVEVSILTTMMNINYQQMDALARLAQDRGVNLRVTVYQPVQTHRFSLSYQQFWDGFRRLLGSSRLLSCTEPVVRAVLGMDTVRSPCGQESVRVTPRRTVAPCVYWPSSSLTIEDLVLQGQGILDSLEFAQATRVPPAAAECPCQGGCASRRALLGNLDQHDPYCPWTHDGPFGLDYQQAPHKRLVRARNYCTTIVM
jgi:MoaA/NifB/PqqE/SkfB family radical SAM enzyme